MNMAFKFLFIIISLFIVGFHSTNTSAYEFVRCLGDDKTYPENTLCEFTDDNLEELEEREDEEEHAEEEQEED
jgi:hypothetical protein